MKLSFTRVSYLLSFSALMVPVLILLRQYAFINHVCSTRVRSSATHIEIIDPQEFVFCNADALANFEHRKKERSQHLFEELCGIQRVNVQPFFTRVALYALTMRNDASVSCVAYRPFVLSTNGGVCKQQFGIPPVADETVANKDLQGVHVLSDYASYKCVFVKRIAHKQVSEKNMTLKKTCRLSALEKLLK